MLGGLALQSVAQRNRYGFDRRVPLARSAPPMKADLGRVDREWNPTVIRGSKPSGICGYRNVEGFIGERPEAEDRRCRTRRSSAADPHRSDERRVNSWRGVPGAADPSNYAGMSGATELETRDSRGENLAPMCDSAVTDEGFEYFHADRMERDPDSRRRCESFRGQPRRSDLVEGRSKRRFQV
jgi:hypothetical protein